MKTMVRCNRTCTIAQARTEILQNISESRTLSFNMSQNHSLSSTVPLTSNLKFRLYPIASNVAGAVSVGFRVVFILFAEMIVVYS